jgi:hypothetical protein
LPGSANDFLLNFLRCFELLRSLAMPRMCPTSRRRMRAVGATASWPRTSHAA